MTGLALATGSLPVFVLQWPLLSFWSRIVPTWYALSPAGRRHEHLRYSVPVAFGAS